MDDSKVSSPNKRAVRRAEIHKKVCPPATQEQGDGQTVSATTVDKETAPWNKDFLYRPPSNS
jgi:hypothetical protein